MKTYNTVLFWLEPFNRNGDRQCIMKKTLKGLDTTLEITYTYTAIGVASCHLVSPYGINLRDSRLFSGLDTIVFLLYYIFNKV